MIIEFKKFLFLTALRLLNDKEQKYKSVGSDGKIYYRAPFPAPPFIEKAWDLIILYSETYVQLCYSIFGGFLDKPKFADQNEEFQGYDYMYRLLQRKRRLLHPFWNLWPKYAKKDYYFSEKALQEVLMSSNQKLQAIQFITTQAAQLQQTNPSALINSKQLINEASMIAFNWISANSSQQQGNPEK